MNLPRPCHVSSNQELAVRVVSSNGSNIVAFSKWMLCLCGSPLSCRSSAATSMLWSSCSCSYVGGFGLSISIIYQAHTAKARMAEGHLNPSLPLARSLIKLGHQVHYLSRAWFLEHSVHAACAVVFQERGCSNVVFWGKVAVRICCPGAQESVRPAIEKTGASFTDVAEAPLVAGDLRTVVKLVSRHWIPWLSCCFLARSKWSFTRTASRPGM